MTSNSNIDDLIAPVFKLGYEHSDKDYDDLKQAIQQLLDEAYKKGYIDGGIAEITK